MKPHIITSLHGKTIRALLFDLGDTLWTFVQSSNWEKPEQETNLRISSILRNELAFTTETDTELLALSQQFRTALRSNIRAHMPKGTEHEPDVIKVVQETLAEFGWPVVTPTLAFTLFQDTQIPLEHTRTLFPDVIATLTELQRRGFLLGVVTNRTWGGAPFLASMDKLGLLNFFAPEAIAISADLRILKPNPAIFQHTLQALDVKPAEALMVGNSLHADITGSNRLHMYAVWKPSPRVIEAFQTTLEEPEKQLRADTLLTFYQDLTKKRYNEFYEEPQPDLIIEHLHDLLAFLPKAGQQ
jgi:FMN phosphatase YigB (HAD superfamily)